MVPHYLPQIDGWIQKISKSNALYPLLIALAIVVVVCGLVFACTTDLILRLVALSFVGFVLWKIGSNYSYFAKNNPDMLRSEEHVIRSQALALIGDEKHDYGTKASDITAVVNSQNPVKESEHMEIRDAEIIKQIDNPKESL